MRRVSGSKDTVILFIFRHEYIPL